MAEGQEWDRGRGDEQGQTAGSYWDHLGLYCDRGDEMNGMDSFDGRDKQRRKKSEYPAGQNNMDQFVVRERVLQKTGTEWVTTGQAKEMLGVSSVNTVKRWVVEGKLVGKKFGPSNWMRISLESIERLLSLGDENVMAYQKLKKDFGGLSDVEFEPSEEDLEEMSDRRMGKLPWEK